MLKLVVYKKHKGVDVEIETVYFKSLFIAKLYALYVRFFFSTTEVGFYGKVKPLELKDHYILSGE